MTRYLLDTHVWFWFLTGSDRLSQRHRELIESAVDACLLSPVVVWEVGLLAKRGRIELGFEFSRWCRDALQKLPLSEAPLTIEISRHSVDLDLPHRDPADRFLAATAIAWQATLLTDDHRLREAQWLDTL